MHSNFIDIKFVTLLSGQLQRFNIKNRNPFKANFRCTICGDSQKSKTKARAWILENPKTSLFHYHCFNCGSSISFKNFLKTYFPLQYNDYVTEKYIENAADKKVDDSTETIENPGFIKGDHLKKIKKISQLKHDHPAKLYITSRCIPPAQHYRIYYAPKFKEWVNSIIPDKIPQNVPEEPRLILPLFSRDKKLIGISARSFNPKALRYITIMFQNVPKIYGLELVNFSKPYFVVEGGIDSFFLDNCIAMVGADTSFAGIENAENATFVHDNEPRNKEICKRMETLLKKGYKVCIWPPNMNGKDINEMVLNGCQDIEKIILDNTYSSLHGLLKLNEWKKVLTSV